MLLCNILIYSTVSLRLSPQHGRPCQERIYSMCLIWDVIEQISGKSIKFNFHFSDWLYTPFTKLPFTTNTIDIGKSVPKIQAVEGLQKQKETKKLSALFWLYLKISFCEFRLILLDHITFLYDGSHLCALRCQAIKILSYVTVYIKKVTQITCLQNHKKYRIDYKNYSTISISYISN